MYARPLAPCSSIKKTKCKLCSQPRSQLVEDELRRLATTLRLAGLAFQIVSNSSPSPKIQFRLSDFWTPSGICESWTSVHG